MEPAPGIAKVVTKIKLGQDDGDAAYWQAQAPEARLAALEEIRREYHLWKYGGEPPMRKVVTIIKMNGELVRRWGEVEPVEDSESPVDETAYLTQSETNRKRLLTAIENINAGRSLIEVSI